MQLTQVNPKALHILSPCLHHNTPLVELLSKLNNYLLNEYVVLDSEDTFEAYSKLSFGAKELFSSNSCFLPWLRKNYLKYDSIVIHGFFNQVLWEVLDEIPKLRKKCIWVVYGGDLCEYKKNSLDPSKTIENQRIKRVIPDMKKILTFTKDEDEILINLYGENCSIGKCMYHQSYLGSINYKDSDELAKFFNSGLNTALVGNSGAESNRHIYVLEKLSKAKFSGQVLLPMTYCLTPDYHLEIIKACEKYFPNRYFLLTELLDNNDYFSLIKKCDYFFMGHLRQQAGQHWMFAFYHGKAIYGVDNTPFVNTLNEKNIFWGDIDNISFDDTYLKKFTYNHHQYEKHYGFEVVKQLWLEALT